MQRTFSLRSLNRSAAAFALVAIVLSSVAAPRVLGYTWANDVQTFSWCWCAKKIKIVKVPNRVGVEPKVTECASCSQTFSVSSCPQLNHNHISYPRVGWLPHTESRCVLNGEPLNLATLVFMSRRRAGKSGAPVLSSSHAASSKH